MAMMGNTDLIDLVKLNVLTLQRKKTILKHKVKLLEGLRL
jgi:hypothetical protein